MEINTKSRDGENNSLYRYKRGTNKAEIRPKKRENRENSPLNVEENTLLENKDHFDQEKSENKTEK